MDINNYFNTPSGSFDGTLAGQMNLVMRRVYLKMTLGLIVTALAAYLGANSMALLEFFAAHPMTMLLLFVAEIGLVIGITSGINKLRILFFPNTGNREIENLTAQIIHRIQYRIAAGIKMLLFHTENLHCSAIAQLHCQRIILCRNDNPCRRTADKNTFAAFKIGKQRIRHMHRV